MSTKSSRRKFLASAPLALSTGTLFNCAAQENLSRKPPEAIKNINAETITSALAELQQRPGSFPLWDKSSLPFSAVLTLERTSAAKEFEWHEARDHLIQVVDGSTNYLLGGTPVGAHILRPGEWLAPASTGAAALTLRKGDWLVIPRGTPHKRSTVDSVTFYLISTTGPTKTA